MKVPYKYICIIYNPNSTGNSIDNAKDFADELKKLKVEAEIELIGTKYAGHAQKIARTIAKKADSVLIVSSSGDGGYNEVINGVLAQPNKKVVTHVLASGNANDHHEATAKNSNIKSIITQQPKLIDVIKVETTIDKKPWTHYAHSYVGIGATPIIGRKLTKLKINFFNEKLVVLKELLKFRYVVLRKNDTYIRYSSVVYTTIDRMSKVMKLSDKASIADGKMELYAVRYRSLWKLVYVLIRAVVIGISETRRLASDEFSTVTKTSIQLDGEVFVIDEKSKVKISCKKQLLKTLI